MNKLLHYLNKSPTIFFILKKDKGTWKLEFVTENVVKVYGKTADDFLSGKFFHEDFIHKDDLESFYEEASKISKIKEKEYTYKPYRIVQNEEVTWISHTTKIIKDKENKTNFYYGYLTDITKQKELNHELKSLSSILDSIFNQSFNFILLLDNKGKLLKANKTSLEIAGFEEQNLIGKYFWDLPWWSTYAKKEKNILKDEISIINNGSSMKNNKYYFDTKGQKIIVDFTYSPLFDNESKVSYILCEGHDITQSINNRKKIDRYVELINNNVYITMSDLSGRIINISDAYCKLTGYTRDELIGKKHSIFKHPKNDDSIFKDLWKTIVNGRLWKGEHKNIKKDGTLLWVENSITPNFDEDGKLISYTSIYNDITNKKEISKLLITDYLTKIYNRRYFNDIFSLELKRARRDNKNFVLMILDIDYFKQYNDTYGHDAGDKALTLVATTLKDTLNRANDFVFRLGGEEFGIVSSEINETGLDILSNRLKQSIENLKIDHKSSNVNKYLTISIGIKVVAHTLNIVENDIYKLADIALYEAKAKGRNQAVICTEDSLK